ncbi:MAG: rhodanese-like domain-containing protein [Ignavibacteria bacterium]|nr:rhodanese-like domain-containing protein [Ignavibacteria bacterium]
MRKIFIEILLILIFTLIIALLGNFFNSKGIKLSSSQSRISVEDEAAYKDEFRNDPYDTLSVQMPLLNDLRQKDKKEGFYIPQNITLSLAKKLYDKNALFIDARKKIDFDAGHIKGAINISYDDFLAKTKEERIEMMRKYNKNGIIIAYCEGGTCDVSIDVAYELARMGFNYVNLYRPGYIAWKNAGYPVEP